MAKVQTHNNQTWFDISIWIYGTADHAMAMALQNGSSITTDINAGTIIEVPELPKNRMVIASMTNIPATGIDNNDNNDGIGLYYFPYEFPANL